MKKKTVTPFPIHGRDSLDHWFHYCFNFDKAAGLINAHAYERHDQIAAGVKKPCNLFGNNNSYWKFKEVFWWFTKFVGLCEKAPSQVIASIAREGRPHNDRDYRLMKEFALIMRDARKARFMSNPSLLGQREIQEICAPFVMVAKVMVRAGLVGPNG